MPEWWSYTISDFLMYSGRTWYRLIEQYNASLWPAHLVAMVLGIGIIALVFRGEASRGRVIAATLSLLWAWIAVGWLWRRYGSISTGGVWFAAAFGVEALLLAWAGVVRNGFRFARPESPPGWVGLLLLLFAVLGYPMVAVFAGRGIRQAEVFGMMPDPTALGTIGVLLLAGGRWRRRLLVIPVAWLALSGAMLWALLREAR